MNYLFKKIGGLLLVFSFIIILVSCNTNKEQTDIVTTMFPQYDIAKNIAGDKLTVSLMTPFGSEIHGYEPTAKDIIRVNNAKLFIYTSDEMEKWAKNIINEETNYLNLSNEYDQVPFSKEDALIDELHYWTDPLTFLQLIDVIKTQLVNIDPINSSYYETNATNYYQEIELVHEELTNYFETKNSPTIYFYGHNALSSFANRYNFNISSLSDHFQPDAELSPGQKLMLKNNIKAANAKFLFTEELIDLKEPNSLIDELAREGQQLTLLELHGFHNITKDQNEKGVTYLELLKQNLKNLKTALN